MNELADRIRAKLGEDPRIAEIRMFGGLCFTLNGNMLIAVRRDGGLLARVGPEQEEAALSRPGVERMVMRGRQLPGYVTVPAGTLTDDALTAWIDMAAAYVGRMPAKTKKKPGRKAGPPGCDSAFLPLCHRICRCYRTASQSAAFR